jgi:hypothetical protein
VAMYPDDSWWVAESTDAHGGRRQPGRGVGSHDSAPAWHWFASGEADGTAILQGEPAGLGNAWMWDKPRMMPRFLLWPPGLGS